MSTTRRIRRAAGWTIGAYAAYAGTTWCRYGRSARPGRDEMDPLLDQFMPEYEVAERHCVRVAAPAAITLSAWLPNVVFRGLAPEEFRTFQEPGYVKIVWTLRADPVGESESVFRTETRVMTTDPTARTKFRWYWARFSPGIVLIRRLMLGVLKTEAERRALEKLTNGQVGHEMCGDSGAGRVATE